jgi:hypothetical protein
VNELKTGRRGGNVFARLQVLSTGWLPITCLTQAEALDQAAGIVQIHGRGEAVVHFTTTQEDVHPEAVLNVAPKLLGVTVPDWDHQTLEGIVHTTASVQLPTLVRKLYAGGFQVTRLERVGEAKLDPRAAPQGQDVETSFRRLLEGLRNPPLGLDVPGPTPRNRGATDADVFDMARWPDPNAPRRRDAMADIEELIIAHATRNDRQILEVIGRQRDMRRALGMALLVGAAEGLQHLARRGQTRRPPPDQQITIQPRTEPLRYLDHLTDPGFARRRALAELELRQVQEVARLEEEERRRNDPPRQ